MQASFAAFIFCGCEGAVPRDAPLSSNRLETVIQLSSLWRQTVIESP